MRRLPGLPPAAVAWLRCDAEGFVRADGVGVLRGESCAVFLSRFRAWRGSDCHTCFNSSCRPLTQTQITSSWRTGGTSTTPAVPTSGSTAWSPNLQGSSCQTCSEGSCTAGGALGLGVTAVVERLELGSGLETSGVDFGPKVNRLKPLSQVVKSSLVMAKVSEITGKYVVWQNKTKQKVAFQSF